MPHWWKCPKMSNATHTNHVPYLSNDFLRKDAYQSNVLVLRNPHQLSLIFADKIQIAARLNYWTHPRAITATHVSHALSICWSLIFWTPPPFFAVPEWINNSCHIKYNQNGAFLCAERLPILIKNLALAVWRRVHKTRFYIYLHSHLNFSWQAPPPLALIHFQF